MKTFSREIIIFVCLFASTTYVNKYVLSVLEFQFPTIFQGWQTLVGFLMLSLLIASRHLPTLMEEVSRSDIAIWLPGMMFYVCSIYSGSRALAKLSVPAYLCLHNLVTVMLSTTQLATSRELTSLFAYSMTMVLVISSIFIGTTDPQFSRDGYFWMCVHILSSGAVVIYSKLTMGRLKLSMIVLAPSSYFLGDAVKAGKFPYLYFSKFYMGCIMRNAKEFLAFPSGIFGVLLSLSTIKQVENHSDRAELSRITGISKLSVSVISLVFFDVALTVNHVIWLLVNSLAAISCEDSSNVEEAASLPYNISKSQRNPMTKEFIRSASVVS